MNRNYWIWIAGGAGMLTLAIPIFSIHAPENIVHNASQTEPLKKTVEKQKSSLEKTSPYETQKSGPDPDRPMSVQRPLDNKGASPNNTVEPAGADPSDFTPEELERMTLREAMENFPIPGLDPDRVLDPNEGYEMPDNVDDGWDAPDGGVKDRDESALIDDSDLGYTPLDDPQAAGFREEALEVFPLRTVETYDRKGLVDGQVEEWTEIWIRARPTEGMQLDELMGQVADLYRSTNTDYKTVKVMHWVGGQPHKLMEFPLE